MKPATWEMFNNINKIEWSVKQELMEQWKKSTARTEFIGPISVYRSLNSKSNAGLYDILWGFETA